MKATGPLISIIMPLKNMQAYLAETLKSIQQQSHELWELHIVDDHSEDDTMNIVRQFSEDARISYVTNTGNGIIPALQKAFAQCNGTMITRMDGDDLMPTHRLASMAHALAKSEIQTVVTGKVKYFGESPVSEGYLKYEQWLNERIVQEDHWDWIYRECVVASPNWMMYKEALEGIGGFDELLYPEDYDLILRCYNHQFQIKGLNEITLFWREHPKRTSRNSKHYNQESFFKLKIKRFLAFENQNKPLFLIGTMRKGKLAARGLLQEQVEFQWFDRPEEPNRKKIYGQEIRDINELPQTDKANALIAVFPNGEAREALESLLKEAEFQFGHNCWYL